MAPPDLTARPFTLGEIIDRAVALTRRHFRALFVALLLAQAPAVLLARAFPDPLELLAAAADPGRAVEAMGRVLRSLAWIAPALIALQLVATGAAAAIVAPTLDPQGGEARPGRGRLLWALATAALAQAILMGAAPVLGALPGLALAFRASSVPTSVAGILGALVGGVGLFVVVTLRLILVPTAAAVEGRAGLSAAARSARLMSPRPGGRFAERPGVRASLVLLTTLVLAVAVNTLAGIPRLVALRLVGAPAGLAALGAHLPVPLEVGLTLFEAAALAAVQPFSMVAMVVFYFDRRARAEALDVERWAERLEPAR
jgi:hypothetical protein